MKIIAVADFHLTLRETHGITTSDGSTRLQDKLDLISQSVKYAVDNKADLYISWLAYIIQVPLEPIYIFHQVAFRI